MSFLRDKKKNKTELKKKDVLRFEQNPNLEEILPEELLLFIFSHFEFDELLNLSIVNTDWHRLASSDDLWKKITNRSELAPTSGSWKHYYIQISKPKFGKCVGSSHGCTISRDRMNFEYKPIGTMVECDIETKVTLSRPFYLEIALLSFETETCWISFGLKCMTGNEFKHRVSHTMSFYGKYLSLINNEGTRILTTEYSGIDQGDTLSFYIKDGIVHFFQNGERLDGGSSVVIPMDEEYIAFVGLSSKNQEIEIKINSPYKYSKITKREFERM